MVTGDAILAATALVGISVLGGGWKLASMLSRLQTQQESQGEIMRNAALLNGKGDLLVRDIADMKNDLRQHIANSDTVHAAMWDAIRR